MAQGRENRFQSRNINVGVLARGIGFAFALATLPPLFAFGAIENIKKNQPPVSQPISSEVASPK